MVDWRVLGACVVLHSTFSNIDAEVSSVCDKVQGSIHSRSSHSPKNEEATLMVCTTPSLTYILPSARKTLSILVIMASKPGSLTNSTNIDLSSRSDIPIQLRDSCGTSELVGDEQPDEMIASGGVEGGSESICDPSDEFCAGETRGALWKVCCVRECWRNGGRALTEWVLPKARPIGVGVE